MQARRWLKTHQASLGLALAAVLSIGLLILIDQHIVALNSLAAVASP